MEKLDLKQKIIIPKNNKSSEILGILKSVSRDDISSISRDIESTLNRPVHDLDWAKHVLCTHDDESLQHYKDYYEALDIVMKSWQPFYFMT